MIARRLTAIPTYYAGVRFRSRLEATWAAFFTALEWQWVYEPFDLDNYIPDFVLKFPDPVIVEVKPIVSEAEWGDANEERLKIAESGWEGESLMVGATLWQGSAYTPRIGWLDNGSGDWDDAYLFECGHCTQASIMHVASHWRCRASGCQVYDPHQIVAATNMREAFAHAKNRTQWLPPR